MGENVKHTPAFLHSEDGEFNGNVAALDDRTPVAALEDRDVDWVDVTGWGVFLGHAIPVEVARELAARVNLYHAYRAAKAEARP